MSEASDSNPQSQPQGGDQRRNKKAERTAASIDPSRLRLSEVYPKAEVLLRLPKRANELKDDCVYVLDTSCLISPFDAGKETIGVYEGILRDLIKADRLRVPAQAMREFVARRTKKIADLYNDVKNRTVPSASSIDFRLIQSLEHHSRLKEKMQTLNKAAEAYRKELNGLLAEIANWQWNDPVSQLYNRVFDTKQIVECEKPAAELQSDFKRRIADELPPSAGSDATKQEGIGDTVIWHTMIQIARVLQKPIVYVTNEKKSDWMSKSGNEVLGVRYELVYEFTSETGQDFAACDFAEFLELNGAKGKAVDDAHTAVALFISHSFGDRAAKAAAMVTRLMSIMTELTRIRSIAREFRLSIREADEQDDVPSLPYSLAGERRSLAQVIDAFGRDAILSEEVRSLLDQIIATIDRIEDANNRIEYQKATMKGHWDEAIKELKEGLESLLRSLIICTDLLKQQMNELRHGSDAGF